MGYIVKKCPSLDNENVCQRCEDFGVEMCENINNCIIKKIIKYCNKNETYGDGYYTNPIVKLLKIKEIKK